MDYSDYGVVWPHVTCATHTYNHNGISPAVGAFGSKVEDGYYTYQLNVTSENGITGAFSGNVNQSYQISGTVSGSSFEWSDPEIGGYGGQFTGEISTNGSMIGEGMWDNNGHGIWYGFWGASGGPALLYSLPVFTLEPSSIVTTAGSAITFTTSALGDPSPTYQWQFDGTNIDNATNSSYSISVTGITNLGFYDVVASNALGTNVSATVSLSFFNIQLFPGVVCYEWSL